MKNETMKKLTEETRALIAAALTSKVFTDVVEKTKAASDADSGSFNFVVSTADTDRQGESVSQSGWDLSFYKQNPIVLWAHDYASLPIGMCTSIDVKDGKLVAAGKFAPADANPFAQQVRKLYDLGMVNATSVGFIPKEYDAENAGVISKSELLEFSLVPVPANPHALRLSQVKELNLDTAMLATKGMTFDIKEDAPVEPTKPGESAVEPATPPAEEKKGEVADEVAVGEAQEQKWQKYMEVCEALDAFCTVYFDEATPVEDFAKLLTETIAILQQVAGGTVVEAAKAAKAMIGERKLQSHKELTNITLVRIVNRFALGSKRLPEGDRTAGDKGGAKKVDDSEGLKDVNDFVGTRELLRNIDKSIEKALQRFNSAARDRKDSK